MQGNKIFLIWLTALRPPHPQRIQMNRGNFSLLPQNLAMILVPHFSKLIRIRILGYESIISRFVWFRNSSLRLL